MSSCLTRHYEAKLHHVRFFSSLLDYCVPFVTLPTLVVSEFWIMHQWVRSYKYLICVFSVEIFRLYMVFSKWSELAPRNSEAFLLSCLKLRKKCLIDRVCDCRHDMIVCFFCTLLLLFRFLYLFLVLEFWEHLSERSLSMNSRTRNYRGIGRAW